MIQHDVLIVGGGIAGCRAALEMLRVNPHLNVGLVAKTHPIRSHSVAAQGGMAASLKNSDPDDNWESHAFDTVKGSDYLADQDAVAILTQEAPEAVIDLEHLGVLFSRSPDGRIAQRAFGGHTHNRACYAADKTGHAILHELVMNLLVKGVTLYEEWYVLQLLRQDNAVQGVVMMRIEDGRLEIVQATAILLATGGYGRVFNTTSNDFACTGDGLAMTAQAGLPLQDMEFVQFHPTGLYPVGVLVSEAVRGEGAYLINAQGDRFMATYAPSRMELAPRDITSRAIGLEVRAGRGIHPDGSAGGPFVYLDLRHLGREKIMSRIPFCWEEAHRLLGIDAVEQPIPVRPTIHYCMGGIPTDTNGRVRLGVEGFVEGLFSAGETACVSVHGGNRLGSNSLLECVVYGRRVGKAIALYVSDRAEQGTAEKLSDRLATQYLQTTEKRLNSLLTQSGNDRVAAVRQSLQDCMTEHCGVFRQASVMQAGIEQLQQLRQRLSHIQLDDKGRFWNVELIQALELESLFTVGEVILNSALSRQESRGAHFREDFPQRDDAGYLQHTLAFHGVEGVNIQHRAVDLSLFTPQERKY
ncbi:MAG: succinate dehydrogenase/fumarate reductase flavoprotein subunit [Prochlorotrichaceae cyanobacterium]